MASLVLNEGDEAYTTNLCQKCFNKHLQAKGEEPLTNVKWREVVVKRRRIVEECGKMIGKEPYLRGVWEHFSCERSKAKKFRELADEEKTGRKTRSVAAGIASQRIPGTSEMLS